MEVGKEARKDPVPHGTPADQYLTKKYFGASDVLFQMVPMPDGSFERNRSRTEGGRWKAEARPRQ